MTVFTLSEHMPLLNQAIDPAIIVSPDISVLEAIALMGKAQGRNCRISCGLEEPRASLLDIVPQSAAIVVQQEELCGIFTERDLVRLATSCQDLGKLSIAMVMTSPVITLAWTGDENVFTALSLFRQYHIRHLPLLDKSGAILGIVSHESIRRLLEPLNMMKWRRVSEAMTDGVVSLDVNASVLVAARLMYQENISCVVLCDGDRPLGILTERDIVQFQSLELDLANLPAETVMSTPLFTIRVSDSMLLAHQQMQEYKIRRLVVVGDRGELQGLLTQTSMLKMFDPMEMYSIMDMLHQSVEQRTDELNQALQKEKELNKLKSRFVSMASHDLRGPITTILTAVELAKINYKRGNISQQENYLAMVRGASLHMRDLLNDLLLLGQAEAGKLPLNPEPLDIHNFGQSLIEAVRMGTGANHEIQLTIMGPCRKPHLDEKLVRQILNNLLSNAIKYSPNGKSITVEIICQEKMTTLKIQDQGLGIPKSDQAKLFNSFQRASNVGDIPGTGLGLAIVKQCVGIHRGSICFQSEPNQGTTFTVSLPHSLRVSALERSADALPQT